MNFTDKLELMEFLSQLCTLTQPGKASEFSGIFLRANPISATQHRPTSFKHSFKHWCELFQTWKGEEPLISDLCHSALSPAWPTKCYRPEHLREGIFTERAIKMMKNLNPTGRYWHTASHHSPATTLARGAHPDSPKYISPVTKDLVTYCSHFWIIWLTLQDREIKQAVEPRCRLKVKTTRDGLRTHAGKGSKDALCVWWSGTDSAACISQLWVLFWFDLTVIWEACMSRFRYCGFQ